MDSAWIAEHGGRPIARMYAKVRGLCAIGPALLATLFLATDCHRDAEPIDAPLVIAVQPAKEIVASAASAAPPTNPAHGPSVWAGSKGPASLVGIRAWPVPALDRASGEPVGAAKALVTVRGKAALAFVADRCPDHLECERIANNAADLALANCGAQCDRCCTYPSIYACVAQECVANCERCQDAPCRQAFCGNEGHSACRARCEDAMSGCAGCRGSWCFEGSALRACRADAAAGKKSALLACDRDCPEQDIGNDGSCSVTCGGAKRPTCAKPSPACTNGRSPDCRCECNTAVGGACVAWDAVCGCN
jgi:hypothetical protein